MAKIVWEPRFNLGIDIIDRQHQEICNAYNRFIAASPRSVERRAGAFSELTLAYLQHFRFEEEVMRAGGYPHHESHTKVHALFMRRMMGLSNRLAHGEQVSADLERLVGRWLISHIRQEDVDYVIHIGEDLNRLLRVDDGDTVCGTPAQPTSRRRRRIPSASIVDGSLQGVTRVRHSREFSGTS